MDSLVTRITSEASQYVNNVDSWVVGFRNYYVSNLGHSQGMAIPVVEFQERDTKLARFLAKNQLQSNEIIEFCELV